MIDKKASEKRLEPKLGRHIKKAGGMYLKFHCISFTGMPDRMILLPGGRIYFAEIKSEGKTPSDRQELVHAILRRLGFYVFTIDTDEKLDLFLALC